MGRGVRRGKEAAVLLRVDDKLRSEALSPDERERVVAYVGHTRNHLIFENAIILPFARLRLTDSDLHTLSLRMRQRRGLGRPTETTHAG